MAYFAIERNRSCIDHVEIIDGQNKIFKDIKQMSYDEIKKCEYLEEFIVAVIDATNTFFDEADDQTVITLIDNDDIFIWSVIIFPGDSEGDLRYTLVDWNKDGKKYKYSV